MGSALTFLTLTGITAMRQKGQNMGEEKIADKAEILSYLTNVMRSAGVDEKTRMKASEQLGKYLGLDVKKGEREERITVTICDDIGRK